MLRSINFGQLLRTLRPQPVKQLRVVVDDPCDRVAALYDTAVGNEPRVDASRHQRIDILHPIARIERRNGACARCGLHPGNVNQGNQRHSDADREHDPDRAQNPGSSQRLQRLELGHLLSVHLHRHPS